MSWRQYECPGCGDTLPSLWASIVHCDPTAYIDDEEDDNPDIIPSSD